MGLLQKVIVDCSRPISQPQSVTVTLSAAEVAVYNAQQAVGTAQAAADAARLALIAQHVAALAQVQPTLTADSIGTGGDAATLAPIVHKLLSDQTKAANALTQAEQAQLFRFLLRALALGA